MTAMIGLPAALVIGLVFGSGIRQVIAAGLVWYAGLAWQTAYIAHVGRSAFGGKSGLETVHWWVYWLVQPLLLAAAITLVWIGSKMRALFARQFPSGRRTASS
jgi:hypothetical protein